MCIRLEPFGRSEQGLNQLFLVAHSLWQTINPTYTCFIAHRDPEMCPLGALAFFLHYIHDYVGIEEKYHIDYTSNKSWRAVSGLSYILVIIY